MDLDINKDALVLEGGVDWDINNRGHTMYYISILYYIVQTVYYILYSKTKKA